MKTMSKEKQNKVYTGKHHRMFSISNIDEENRTVELSFSSDEPYERWWGIEILSHKEGSIDFSRLKDSAPLLADHNFTTQIGVVEDAYLDGSRARAKVRFSKNSQMANEFFADVVDGIRRNVSVGYEIKEMELTGSKDDIDEYTVTKWLPFEISMVSVPADASVGVGRELELKQNNEKVKKMDKENNQNNEVKNVDVEAVKLQARKDEQSRVKEIMAIADKFDKKDLGQKAISEGMSVSDFRGQVLENMNIATPVSTKSTEIGMSDKEVKEFSFTRALYALANPTDRKAQEAASFEFEASRAAASKMGVTPQGILVPMEVLRRDLNAGTATAGGNLVGTDLLGGSFIEMLRNSSVMLQLATSMTGLVGDIAIPKQTGGATSYWLDEGASPTETQQTIGQLGLTPKTVGAYTDITRKLLKQSSIDVEAFVRGDIARALGLAIDLASITGTGADGQPLGILNTTGVGLVELGDNGAAPTFGKMVDLETEVAIDNADIGALKYITNARGRGKMKQTAIESGHPAKIWENNMVNGYDAIATNQIPANLTKGDGTDLSAVMFGNFADLIIGMWGGLDLTVDPYSNSTSGTVRIVGLQDVDIAVRRAESFAVIKDMVTA